MSPPTPSGGGDDGRLLSTRRGSLIAAAFTALVAVVVLLVFLSNYRSSVGGSSKTETVLAARNLLPKGSSGDTIATGGLFQAVRVKESQVKPGAFTDPGSLRGQVATHQLFAGEQLTSADFTTTLRGVLTSLGGDQRAIAVPLDASHGLAGNIEDGDHVDVYGAYDVTPNGNSGGGGGNRNVQFTRQLLQDVLVLKAPTGGSGGIGANSQATAVLRVPEASAGTVALTAEYGKVWLTLRPAAGARSPSTPTTDFTGTALAGVNPFTLTRALNSLGSTFNNVGALRRLLRGVGQ